MNNYYILDPTGNITAIVTKPTEVNCRAGYASQIMKLHPTVEQVGFLLPGGEEYDGELQMAGGEFCGNASMSAAAVLAMESGIQSGENRTLFLNVSGNPKPVRVELQALTDTVFKGKVTMPSILGMEEITLSDGTTFPIVFMPGIVHALLPESFGVEKAESILPALCERQKADAMGMMLLSDDYTRLYPIVYVPGAQTLVHEHSCASGTAATGAYIAAKKGETIEKAFDEPGGSLTVSATPDGEIQIEGIVSLIK